jgi:pyruvate ferredoxin oxidoreductase delta subunit
MSDRFDASKADLLTGEQLPIGARIPAKGNSDEYVTGGWRSERPVRDADKCTDCLICWIFCPDTSIHVADEKLAPAGEEFDLAHCKGCGICAEECPTDCITMVPEGCELREE